MSHCNHSRGFTTHQNAPGRLIGSWLFFLREGVAITPQVKEHIWTALTSLASAPIAERTLTGLAVLLQSNDLKQALRPYLCGRCPWPFARRRA